MLLSPHSGKNIIVTLCYIAAELAGYAFSLLCLRSVVYYRLRTAMVPKAIQDRTRHHQVSSNTDDKPSVLV